MKIYVMRHGTTVWNEIKRIQGHSQNRLSKNGVMLANEASEKLKNVKFDVIFSSPLMRTMQTANIVNAYHNLKVQRNELLIEIGQGIFTGRLVNSLTPKEQEQRRLKDKSCNLESYDSVYNRASLFLEKYIKGKDYKNVLIVSHGAVCSFLECLFLNIKPDYSNKNQVDAFKNAEIKCFEI